MLASQELCGDSLAYRLTFHSAVLTVSLPWSVVLRSEAIHARRWPVPSSMLLLGHSPGTLWELLGG